MAESWQLGHRQRATMDAGEPRVVQLWSTGDGPLDSGAGCQRPSRSTPAREMPTTLTDVSQLLGFAAPSTFSRWFRGRFGVSPSQWRDSAAHRVPDGEENGLAPRQREPAEQAQLLGG